MDSQLSKTLADCLAEIEGGASVDDCLKRHPDQASELRPHLESWSAFGGAALVQPSVAAFNRGRQAMRSALTSAPGRFGPLAAARMAPAWAAVVAAAVVLLGGAAGASAALGGPNVAGDALDAVGVTNGDGGISHSSASDRGLACANPNAFEGKANSEDKAQNAVDAQSKEKCSPGNCDAETGTGEVDEAAETDDAKGDDADEEIDDANEGNEEPDDVDEDADVDQEDGANDSANGNANGNGNGNANANGQSNAQPCTEDGEGDNPTESEGGINNAPDAAGEGKDNANENASQGTGNAEDAEANRNDNGAGGPQDQGGGQNQD